MKKGFAMTEHPPQRFRWRAKDSAYWDYGCCIYAPGLNMWRITTFLRTANMLFESDPWEAMGHVIGDAAEFQWLDNDLNWQGDVMQKEVK